MPGSNPLVAEYTERDAVKAGVLWRDRSLSVDDFRNSSGLILTGATTPIKVVSTANLIRWAAGVANAILVTVDLPGDYNEELDKLHLRCNVFKSTAGDVGAAITGTVVYTRVGVAPTTASTVVPAPVVSDAVTPTLLDLNFSGNSLKGKDSLTFTLTPDAHATAVIDLYGATLRYIGGTSLYNATDRYAS